MLLSEAKEILKRNGYRLVEAEETAEYGDGATIFTPTGADGQWPGRYDFICNAILNNEVNALKNMMYDGIQFGDYNDGEDDESNIDFDDEYDREFKKDYSLVFKGKYIGDALEFMINYDNEFLLAPFDMMNLFHAGEKGCSAKTLATIIDNYIYATGDGDDEAFDDMTWKQVLAKVKYAV